MIEKFADFNSYQYEINLNIQTPSWLKLDSRTKRPGKRDSDQPLILDESSNPAGKSLKASR